MTIIEFCSAYGVSSCPFCGSVLIATSMHTKPHLLNARARGLHCVYVSLVLHVPYTDYDRNRFLDNGMSSGHEFR